MTEDGMSRRQVLRATGLGGTLGIAGGVVTGATFTDTEDVQTNFVTSGLDLRIVTNPDVDPCQWPGQIDPDSAAATDMALGPEEFVGVAMAVPDYAGPVTLRAAATGGGTGDQIVRFFECTGGQEPERIDSLDVADLPATVELRPCITCSWADPFVLYLTSTGGNGAETAIELSLTATQCREESGSLQ